MSDEHETAPTSERDFWQSKVARVIKRKRNDKKEKKEWESQTANGREITAASSASYLMCDILAKQ